jgi:cell division septal protein FtsQ
VKRAEAKRRFPGTVEMAIEEHEPVLLLSLEQLWYVNADGTPFKRARTDSLDFPLLTGLDSSLAHTRPDIAQRIVLQSLHIVETVEHQTELGPERVSEVHFSQRAGFEVVLRNGTRLVLGWQDPDQQLSRFARLMEVGLDPSIPQRVDLDAGSVAIATPLSNPT